MYSPRMAKIIDIKPKNILVVVKRLGPVGQSHHNFSGASDHMIVGEDMPLGIDDDPGADADQFPLKLLGHIFGQPEEAAEKGIVFVGIKWIRQFLVLGHFDVHHGRDRFGGHLFNGRA